MAKPLNKKQPTSSVDRLLDMGGLNSALEAHDDRDFAKEEQGDLSDQTEEMPRREATREARSEPRPAVAQRTIQPARATEPSEIRKGPALVSVPPRQANAPERTGEAVNSKREFHLTRSADETMEELVVLYRKASQSNLTRSHVLRAMLRVIKESMPSLRDEALKIGPLKRPSNAKGSEADREEFEEIIAEAFRKGLRG